MHSWIIAVVVLCSSWSNMSPNQFLCATLQDEAMDMTCWCVCSREGILLTRFLVVVKACESCSSLCK